MEKIVELPAEHALACLDRQEAVLDQEILENFQAGHWEWEFLVRSGQHDSEALDEALLACERQIELLAEIAEAHSGMGLPVDVDVRCQWLLDRVEDLRGLSPLLEEFYWLCKKMDTKRAAAVRARSLRVVG